jgi:hypothetical protein
VRQARFDIKQLAQSHQEPDAGAVDRQPRNTVENQRQRGGLIAAEHLVCP